MIFMEKTNNENVKTPKTTKEKVIFGFKIGGNVIFYLVIIALFLFSIMNINAGGKGGIPNLFGKGMLSVQSDSMTSSGKLPDEYNEYSIKQFSKGDLVYVDILNSKGIQKLKVGDVVTFYDDSIKAFNTHRIVYISHDEDGSLISISCQGDFSVSARELVYDPTNEELADKMYEMQTAGEIQTFADETLSNIKGIVTGVNRGAGKVLDNIQQNWLFYFVIPVLALLLFEVFMVIKNITDLKNEKAKASLATDRDAMLQEVEAERERIRQELLKEMGMAPKEEIVEPTLETTETQVEEKVEETTEEPKVEDSEVTEDEVKTE